MAAITALTANVLLVDKGEARHADATIIIDGEAATYFRGPSQRAIYLKRLPSDLTRTDLQAINKEADRRENAKNIAVKEAVATSLQQFFNNESFKMFELGCGKFPLVSYFPEGKQPDYHGIESDPDCINVLHQMNLTASDWGDLKLTESPERKRSVAVSIYAMHFMVNDKLAKRLNRLTADNGFFVGNFYLCPTEQKECTERERLKSILDRHNMTYFVIDDPASNANEYWIIAAQQNSEQASAYARTLKAAIAVQTPHQ